MRAATLPFDPEAEDIHMFVEAELTQRLGETGKRLHTARSRNDQVALDMRMYLREQAEELGSACCKELSDVLCDQAEEHTETVMPGYTHLQRAQPITFGHHLMAYAQMFLRDLGRLKDCDESDMDRMPLGLRRPGRHHLSHRPGHGAPGCWDLTGSPPTAWTGFPTGISVLSWPLALVHHHDASLPFFRGDYPLVLLGV